MDFINHPFSPVMRSRGFVPFDHSSPLVGRAGDDLLRAIEALRQANSFTRTIAPRKSPLNENCKARAKALDLAEMSLRQNSRLGMENIDTSRAHLVPLAEKIFWDFPSPETVRNRYLKLRSMSNIPTDIRQFQCRRIFSRLFDAVQTVIPQNPEFTWGRMR